MTSSNGPPGCSFCVNGSCWCPEVGFPEAYKNQTTCVGCDVGFNLQLPFTCYCPNCCGYLTWTAPGGDPSQKLPTYDYSGCGFTTHWHTTGLKTVTASLPCGSYDSLQVTVIEVASLLPDVGEEFDDGDGDPNTKSFAVCGVVDPDPNVVTVTATPDPCVSEEILLGCGCWTLEGGDGNSLLFRTVDRTTPGVTTITCTCGPSWKKTKIYVGNPIIVTSFIRYIKVLWGVPIALQSYPKIKGYYDKSIEPDLCWDSCYTSKGRKFNHLHATNDFPFTVKVDINGDGKDEVVSVSASESDAYWDTEYLGYVRKSSATFSQNCHGHAQGKSYWIDDNPIVIEDDYVTTTGMDGEFEYNPGADHSIKILFFYPWGYLSTTSEKMHHSGVYARTFLPPGLIPATMYKKK